VCGPGRWRGHRCRGARNGGVGRRAAAVLGHGNR
jgi:hypothetical protein